MKIVKWAYLLLCAVALYFAYATNDGNLALVVMIMGIVVAAS